MRTQENVTSLSDIRHQIHCKLNFIPDDGETHLCIHLLRTGCRDSVFMYSLELAFGHSESS